MPSSFKEFLASRDAPAPAPAPAPTRKKKQAAVAESLRLHAAQRVIATLDPDLPFFEACAPSQTCARNLHEPGVASRKTGPLYGI